jgi:hypothetical protein
MGIEGAKETVTVPARQEEFLQALALISTASLVFCLTITALLLVARSGLGTPGPLVLLCASTVLSAAYAPFLIPERWHPRSTAAKGIFYPLLMLVVLFSPIVLLWLPSWLAYLYVIAGLIGFSLSLPCLARLSWRSLAVIVLTCIVLGFHVFTAQGLHGAFLPELMTLGRFSGDPYLHAAIASMIRYHGVPSVGLDGVVPFQYHAGSHHWFAAIGGATGADSAQAYMVGRSVFMLPALYLALFVTALCLRRTRPYDASFLVVVTTVILTMIDGAKLDQYTYRSESEVFGIIVLLLALPLLGEIIAHGERSSEVPWSRLWPWLPIILLAGWVKASVGVILAIVVSYALLRTARRPLAIGALATLALAAALSVRGLRGGMGEFFMIRPLGFLLSGYSLVTLSLVFAFGLAAAVALPGLRRRWLDSPLSWEQLVLVTAASAAVPVLVLSHFAAWYFVDALLWFTLAVLLARLSRDSLTHLWRFLRALDAGPIVIGLAVTISAATMLRAFTPGGLVGVTRELLSGLDVEERHRLVPDGPMLRPLFVRSLTRHHVLFGPEFRDAIGRSYGARVVALIRHEVDREGRSALAVFVPPENVRFWRYAVDCQSQPLFIPALAAVPMLQGLPPISGDCRLPRMFGYADYGPSSRSTAVDDAELCRHARGRGLQRVLVLRDVDAPQANTTMRCDS